MVAKFCAPLQREPKTTLTVWRYKNADWHCLRHFFRTLDWSTLLSDDGSASCHLITERILEGMHRFIPSKTLSTRPSDPRWWTPECTQAIQAKRQAWLAMRHHPDFASKEEFAATRTAAMACLQLAKQSYLQLVKNRLTGGCRGDRKWWATIKRACGDSRDSESPVLEDEHGREYISSADKGCSFCLILL